VLSPVGGRTDGKWATVDRRGDVPVGNVPVGTGQTGTGLIGTGMAGHGKRVPLFIRRACSVGSQQHVTAKRRAGSATQCLGRRNGFAKLVRLAEIGCSGHGEEKGQKEPSARWRNRCRGGRRDRPGRTVSSGRRDGSSGRRDGPPGKRDSGSTREDERAGSGLSIGSGRSRVAWRFVRIRLVRIRAVRIWAVGAAAR